MNLLLQQITQQEQSLSRQPQGQLQTTELAILRNANFLAVEREHEGHQVFVLAMGADRGVRNLGATRVLRAEQHTARHMVEERGANTWGAPKVLRGKQITA